MLASLRVPLLADIPDGKRRDRLPQWVVRRKHPVIPIRIEGETALIRPAWLASDRDVASLDAIVSDRSELGSILLQRPRAEIHDWPCREGPPPAEAFELKADPALRGAFPDQPPGAIETW